MKNSISVLFIITLLQSCVAQSNTDTTIDLIKKAETGLTATQVYITGDSTASIEERMEHYGIPGVSIAVIHNGKVAWAKGYGVADKESNTPVTTQTLFQAVSQPVSAYGALRLVEQNKIGLNEDINNYLKSWKLPESEFAKDKKITIKNLLNHSAGINVHAFSGYSKDEPIPTLVDILNGTPPTNSNPIILEREPGVSHWSNSGGGFTVVQQMMIDVEDKKFPEIMDELVFQPLGMSHSTFNQPLNAAQLKMAATGYERDGSMVEGKNRIYPEMAAQGLWTTAEDYAKLIINIQQTPKNSDAKKGLSKELTAQILSEFVKDNYGLGTYLYNRKDNIYFGQGLWNRGFYSSIVANRDKGYGVVVLTNTTHPAFVFELFRSVALAYEWDNYFPIYEKMETESSFANKITGRYQTDNRVIEIIQKDKQLFSKNILNTQPEEIIRVSDSAFARRSTSRLMQFKPNAEDGTINLLSININDNTIATTLVKRDDGRKEPVEYLVEGDFEKALNAYKVFMEQNPTHPTVDEEYIDDLGELFFSQNRTRIALDAFKLNTKLFPHRFQVYDRYANYLRQTEEIELAIVNYNKVLELNPENNRAKEKLKELQKSE